MKAIHSRGNCDISKKGHLLSMNSHNGSVGAFPSNFFFFLILLHTEGFGLFHFLPEAVCSQSEGTFSSSHERVSQWRGPCCSCTDLIPHVRLRAVGNHSHLVGDDLALQHGCGGSGLPGRDSDGEVDTTLSLHHGSDPSHSKASAKATLPRTAQHGGRRSGGGRRASRQALLAAFQTSGGHHLSFLAEPRSRITTSSFLALR